MRNPALATAPHHGQRYSDGILGRREGAGESTNGLFSLGSSSGTTSEVETLKKELQRCEQRNSILEQELELAATEAIAARDALGLCVMQAQAELQADEHALIRTTNDGELGVCDARPAQADAIIVAKADAAALAGALVASEMALEAALAERDDLLAAQDPQSRTTFDAIITLKAELAEALGENGLLSSELFRSLASEEAAVEEKAAIGTNADVLVCVQAENEELQLQLAQREEAWASHTRRREFQVQQLQSSLVAAWEQTEMQASDFALALTEVQQQVAGQTNDVMSPAAAATASLAVGGMARCSGLHSPYSQWMDGQRPSGFTSACSSPLRSSPPGAAIPRPLSPPMGSSSWNGSLIRPQPELKSPRLRPLLAASALAAPRPADGQFWSCNIATTRSAF